MKILLVGITFIAATIWSGCFSDNFVVYPDAGAELAETSVDARAVFAAQREAAVPIDQYQKVDAALDMVAVDLQRNVAASDEDNQPKSAENIFSLDQKTQVSKLSTEQKIVYCLEYFAFTRQKLGTAAQICQAEAATEYQGELSECQQAYNACAKKKTVAVTEKMCADIFGFQPQVLDACLSTIKQVSRCLKDRESNLRKYWSSFNCEMNMEPRYPDDPSSCKTIKGCDLSLP